MKKLVISIGRQFGSGGREIAKKLAEKLDIAYYDKELLAIAAEESGLALNFLEQMDEKKTNSLLYSLSMGLKDFGWSGGHTSMEQVAFEAQREAMFRAVKEGSCVIVGRCADYILRDEPGLIKIFLSADEEQRIKRIMQRDALSEKEAKEKMRRMDKARMSYYHFNTEQQWGNACCYDLCVNVSRLGVDATVDFILQFIENKI